MKPRNHARMTDPSLPAVRAAERLVLASRSPRAATVGGEDSSIGDLLLAMIGSDHAEALEQLGMELEFAAAAVAAEPHAALRLPVATLLSTFGRRAAAGAELHRRIDAARRSRQR